MMSELLLPEHVAKSLERPLTPEDEPEGDKGSLLPDPVGYKILCAVPEISEKLEGTDLPLYRDAASMRAEEHGTCVLFVIKVGPDAYQDKAKFPNGPWCKAGDFVVVRTYSGTRFRVFGKEFRVLNDDGIECVVSDPRGVGRV